MGTLLKAADRGELLERLQKLKADDVPLWGKMNCPKMLAHLNDALRMTYGDLEVRSRWAPFRYFPLKQFAVYVMPWPKGLPTAPELIARSPDQAEAFEREMGELRGLIDRFAQEAGRSSWPSHPLFGRLSEKDWGTLAHRHIDHHLRQFGL